MRDVNKVHTTVGRHLRSASLCQKGGLDIRERSEFPQYQTYQRSVRGAVGCGVCVAKPRDDGDKTVLLLTVSEDIHNQSSLRSAAWRRRG